MFSWWRTTLSITMMVILAGCFGNSDPEQDEIPPIINIDFPGQGDSFCESIEIEITAHDVDPGLCSICIYMNGNLIHCWEPEDRPITFEPTNPYTIPIPDSLFGDVEIELVVKDCDGNEASEIVDVYLINDTTDPVVTLTPATIDTYNNQCGNFAVDVTEDNYVSYEYFLNGNLVGSGDGAIPETLTICGDDLSAGMNTLTFEVTDYCGNVGIGTALITHTSVEACLYILAAPPEECKCGEVTFEAWVTYPCIYSPSASSFSDSNLRDMPDLSEVCFFFDGENIPRFCSDTEPFEYTVDVTDTFEAETHVVWARSILDDGTYADSEPVYWVKSCEPSAVIQVVSIDHCNRMVTVSAGLSSDDNVEPGLTFEFDSQTCAGNWTTNQIDPHQSLVTFTFDTEICGFGDYDISVTVYDGWCDGYDTDTTTVTFIDDCFSAVE